jgi:hypothetical protein
MNIGSEPDAERDTRQGLDAPTNDSGERCLQGNTAEQIDAPQETSEPVGGAAEQAKQWARAGDRIDAVNFPGLDPHIQYWRNWAIC